MKRRQFIEGAAAAAAAAAIPSSAVAAVVPEVASDGPPPAHTLHPLIGRVEISRSGLPEEFWDSNARVASIISGIYADSGESKKLFENPAGYLRELGVDVRSEFIDDDSLSTIAIVSEHEFKASIAAGDYRRAMRFIEGSKRFSRHQSSTLRENLMKALASNRGRIFSEEKIGERSLEDVESIMLSMVESSGGHVTADDLTAVNELFAANLSEHGQQALIAVSIAAIFVTAAAYVVAVVVVGAWVFISGAQAPRWAVGMNPGFDRRLAQLDSELMADYERTLKIAALSGRREIAELGHLNLIRAESEAVISALRESGYLSGDGANDEKLIDAATKYAARVAGLSE